MTRKRMTRRSFLATTASAGAAFALGAGRAKAAGKSTGRVVILGFDGMEPGIVGEMMDRGNLPNLAKLRTQGVFAPLGSTIPPQSPVAWSSFTTCKNPGGHNIYDFIRRNPGTPGGRSGPMPAVGTGEVKHPEFNSDGGLKTPATPVDYRTGASFWSVADAQGKRCKILNVPFAYPGDTMKHGVQLSALGVPDLRGTTSTFITLAEGLGPNEVAARLSGGKNMALDFNGGDTAKVRVPGPRNKQYRFRDPNAYTKTDLTISVDRASGRGRISSGSQKVEIKLGEWSEWLHLEYPMTPSYTAYGITRFYPLEMGDKIRIYMAAQQYDPARPYAPISSPGDYANDLAGRYGPFKTIGWAFDTHALRQDALTEEAFLRDVEQTMAWRERLTLDEIDRGDFDLLISAWTATDRVGHMFWRYRDEKHPLYNPEMAKKYGKTLEKVYQVCDRITGNVMAKLREDDLVMILSDHGFESWRTAFDPNNWLVEHGYLKLSNPTLARDRGFLLGIDWANTQVYAVGLSSMYINMAGRESKGIVKRGDAKNLVAKVRDEMLGITNPATGEKVLDNIYTFENFTGESAANAPDFSMGYARYYQAAKSAAKGAVSDKRFTPNLDKWSGEHAAADVARLPGVFFCNRKAQNTAPNIRDLGVTALRHLGVDVPADFEGEVIV